MKPNASICPRLGRFGSRVRVWLLALAASLPALAAAAPPQPALKLSTTLAPPAAEPSPDERALLRVEFRAAQTQASEADIVGDILARVRHMDDMIREVRLLVDAWPGTGAVAVAVVPTPVTPASAAMPDLSFVKPQETHLQAVAAPPAEEKPSSPSGSLILRALMASVIIFLFWLLGQRHRYLRAQRRKAEPAAPESAAAAPAMAADVEAIALPPQAPPRRRRSAGIASAASRAASAVAPETAGAIPTATPAPQPLEPLDFEIDADTSLAAPGGTAAVKAPPHSPAADQSLELAEIMVSMGLAHGAAEALIERIHSDPRRALYHWLKLLDVYRRSDMQEDFERASHELHQSFNVQPEGWLTTQPDSRSLEHYPHIIARLQQLWPSSRHESAVTAPECVAFLGGLLEDNRSGTRHGFPQSVAEEILLLLKVLDREAQVEPVAD
ncbi:MAG: hypothetical protein KJ787_11860 [Gammaproteobacteria bacterium]|nr:hypothetical protein [Gammaproteobacteria bacterium]MBU1647017.1 hypothetical protein [Gammaproteobacteria bacterium]MBU1972529.1 hypothetical protein [Gammaproteobacteria bacterium]